MPKHRCFFEHDMKVGSAVGRTSLNLTFPSKRQKHANTRAKHQRYTRAHQTQRFELEYSKNCNIGVVKKFRKTHFSCNCSCSWHNVDLETFTRT